MNLECILFLILVFSLYFVVTVLKRIEDKERKILTMEEVEHLVVWRNDPLRKVYPPEKLETIVEKIKKGQIVIVNSKKVYNDIIRIVSNSMEFKNLVLTDDGSQIKS